jgi:hypothetical protein
MPISGCSVGEPLPKRTTARQPMNNADTVTSITCTSADKASALP